MVATLSLWADVVPVSEAQVLASQFLQKNASRRAKVMGKTAAASTELKLSAVGDASSYYIFNVGTDEGFVVVSGDDATEEILGYSYSGHIHPDSMPCNMRMLFDSYTDQIKFIREHGITREMNSGARKAARKADANSEFHLGIGHAMARFGQNYPYNILCPKDKKGNRTVTGCTATAMAELLFYHQWPTHITSSIPGYTCNLSESETITLDAIPTNTKIDWRNILIQYIYYQDYGILPDELSYPQRLWTSDEQANAIAQLMIMTGTSVRMSYGVEASGADDRPISYSLKKYFGFQSANLYHRDYDREYERSGYSDEQWNKMLCDELLNNGPVIYNGFTKKGEGHSFLLEGYSYDGENYYYDINFGWDGVKNNSFLLSIIKGAFTYTSDQSALLDAIPQSTLTPNDVPLKLYSYEMYLADNYRDVFPRSTDSGLFENIHLYENWYNHYPVDASFVTGLGFFNLQNEQVDSYYFDESWKIPYSFKESLHGYFTFSCGSNLTSGKYMIKGLSKEVGTNTWQINDNSQRVYAEAWVCDDMLSIKSSDEDDSKLSVSRMHVKPQIKAGTQNELFYYVLNKGEDYDGAILIVEKAKNAEGQSEEVALKIAEAHLGQNRSMIIPVSWTPKTTGEYEICVLDKRWKPIYSQTFDVVGTDVPVENLAVTDVTIEKGSIEEQSFGGSILRGTMTITNQDNCAFADTISLVLFNGLTEKGQMGYNLEIGSGESVEVDFEFRGLKVGQEYTLKAWMGEDMLQFYESPALESHFPVPDIPDDESADVANHALTHYEYWFDDDYRSRQRVSISGTRTNIVEAVNTEALSHGLHYFNVRLQQDDGEYSPVSSTQFMKSGVSNKATKSIEYWFDDDFGNKLTADLSGSPLEVDDAVGTDQLGNGLHRLNARVKYTDNVNTVYSPVSTTPFFKHKDEAPTQIVYWFDEDYAQRATTPLPAKGSNGLTTINFDLSDMTKFPLGLHRMHLCFATSENKVISSVYKFLLLKMVSGTVDKIQYWVDDDYDNAQTVDGVFETEDGEYVFVDPFNLSGASFGNHTVNYRAVVDGGRIYSPVSTAHVMKIGRGKADKIEYWVDGDRRNIKTVTGTLDAADGAYVFVNPFDLSDVSNGIHRVYYRVATENGEPGTAVDMMTVIVKSMYGPGPALITSYSIVADEETVLASGTLDLKSEVELNLQLDASSLSEGEHTLKATFWNSFGGSTATDWTPFWVTGPLTGDVNQDGQVGIGDIVAITNVMAGITTDEATKQRADVNGDGEVGIGDIVAITNIMAGR